MVFGEVIDIAFEVGSGEGAKWSVLRGFACIFDEMLIFLKFVWGLLDRSFYNPDLGMRQVILVISVPKF